MVFVYLSLCYLFASGSKAIEILEAYEGTLEDDYPPENERCEHGEMLLYKVKPYYLSFGTPFLLHLASYGIGILVEELPFTLSHRQLNRLALDVYVTYYS